MWEAKPTRQVLNEPIHQESTQNRLTLLDVRVVFKPGEGGRFGVWSADNILFLDLGVVSFWKIEYGTHF